MARSAKWYGPGLVAFFRGQVNWETDAIFLSLHTALYVPSQDVHQWYSDVTNEVTGTNYTAGGVQLAGRAITYDPATNRMALDANDASWPSVTFTGARWGVIRNATPALPANQHLIGYLDFDADWNAGGGLFVVEFDPTGVLRVTAAA